MKLKTVTIALSNRRISIFQSLRVTLVKIANIFVKMTPRQNSNETKCNV